jgi:hypothetical protein
LTHNHVCTNTCFKYGKVCRFLYYNVQRLFMRGEDGETYFDAQFRHGKQLEPEIRIEDSGAGGRRGKQIFIRIHPDEGISNAYGLAILRCNFDTQLQERLVAIAKPEDEVFETIVLETIAEHKVSVGTWPLIRDVTDKAIEKLFKESTARQSTHEYEAAEARACIETWLDRAAASKLHYAAPKHYNGVCEILLKTPKGTETAEDRRVELFGMGFSDDSDKMASTPLDSLARVSSTPICPQTRIDTPHESLVKELHAQLGQAMRDGHDQSMYTANYASKPGTVMKSKLEKMRIGIHRLIEDERLKNVSCPVTEKAAKRIIRAHTAGNQATFEPMNVAVFHDLFDEEAIRTIKPWTTFVSFIIYASKAAYRDKYGCFLEDKEAPDEGFLDAIVFADSDAVVRPDTAAGAASVTSTNQKDDWLHRCEYLGDESSWTPLTHLGLLLYSEVVTRTNMPYGKRPEDLVHPFYAFAAHYSLHHTYCQKFDPLHRAPCLPVLEGIMMKTKAANLQSNALYKAAVLRPLLCKGEVGQRCSKTGPFHRLCDLKGYVKPWEDWFAIQEKRAALAQKYYDYHMVYPSWAIMYALTHPPLELAKPPPSVPSDDPRWTLYRRRVMYPWILHIAQRSVDYANNLDAIAEAAGTLSF